MSEKRKPNDGRIALAVIVLIRVLVAAAFAVAAYLAWTSLSGNAVAGCGPESSCDQVLRTRWAYWLGIPVSIPALLLYVGVFALTFRLTAEQSPAEQRRVWPWFLAAGVLMAGAALWFTGLQVAVIHSVCKFCLSAHALGLAAALLIFFNAPVRPAPEKQWQQEKQVFVPPVIARNSILAAITGLAVLAVGQVAHRQKMYSVQSVADMVRPAVTNALVASNPAPPRVSAVETSKVVTPNPAETAKAVNPTSSWPVMQQPTQQLVQQSTQQQMFPLAQPMQTNRFGGNVIDHKFDVYLGMFQFDLREVPLIGSTEASYAMLSLFDYTCHHCRLMHANLMQAHRTFGDKFAIVSFPMPLDARCNYTVRRTPRDHTNACAFARLGLTVWRADKTKHPEFEEYVFTGEKPPPFSQAVERARQLVGTEAFEKAAVDQWPVEQLKRSISMYATNLYHIHSGALPQLMIYTNLTTGMLEQPGDLLRILDKQLGLRVGR